jgi:hypothetical protein
MSVVSGRTYGRLVPDLPAVVSAVSSTAPVVPKQRTSREGVSVVGRRIHERDMSLPYRLYDPMRPVVVSVDGVSSEGDALGASGDVVHVGWVGPDGKRRLAWLPRDAVSFA